MRTTLHQFIIDSGWDFGCVESTAERGISDFDASLMSAKDAAKLVAYCRARVAVPREPNVIIDNGPDANWTPAKHKARKEALARVAEANALGLAEIEIFEQPPGSEHDDELRAEYRYTETLGQQQDRERNR
jgi:hypothetical protein